jgi:hypothetical protein
MSLTRIAMEPPVLVRSHSGEVAPGLMPGGDLSARCNALAEQARGFGRLGPGAKWLAQAARSIAEVVLPWELQVGPPTDERSYRLLLQTEGVEAWLIHWPSGGRLQLHDHGGASGALQVVSGVLDETYVDGRGRLARRDHGVGRGVAFGPRYVHDVANTTEFGATSVHVYAPTADTMYFYRYEGPGRLRRVGEAPFEETDQSGEQAMASCSGDALSY